MFIHEHKAVYADRFIDDGDRKWFEGLLTATLQEQLGYSFGPVEFESELLICGDFMIPGAEPKIYEQILELDSLQPTIEEYLNESCRRTRRV